jgi:general secretion pathway protein A
MYLELFNLTELPFRLSPDPSFLYLSRHHARAKAYMESTIWFTDGFVIITGEIGAGKTTLIETFLKELEKDVVVALINQTQLSPVEFLQTVLVQFGFQPFQMKKVELLATLNNYLIEQYTQGRRIVLIIDEAQNLSTKVLEEVRMLSGVETTSERILRIILVGQPELNHKLDLPELAQLTQRVRLRFHLTPLSREDTENYIQHRLEVAGSNGRQIFEPDTFQLIYRYTGGVPRLVNTLCDTAMMSAFALDRDVVTAAEVQTALDELRWSEPNDPSVRLPAIKLGTNASGIQGARHGSAHNQTLARVLLSRQGKTLGEFPLTAGRTIIGRTAENDLQIDSKFISRHHAQVITTANSCFVEDLNSTNGISYNGKRIRRRVLNDGDVLQIGEHELVYVDERQARMKSALTEVDDSVPLLSETMHLPEASEPLEASHESTLANDKPS